MFFRENIQEDELLVGVDIGSTTTKIVAVTPQQGEIVYWDYQRHNAEQARSVKDALEKFQQYVPQASIRLCLTGSGAKLLAESLDVPFIQEVVANSVALKRHYDRVGTAIELGGQDAKIIFFKKGQSLRTDQRSRYAYERQLCGRHGRLYR